MFGSCPIATNRPCAGSSRVSPVSRVAQQHAASTGTVSPSTSSTTAWRDELDLLVGPGAVDHDLRRAELVAPVHERDLRGELRQEDRLLHRRVAAADDHDLLLAEEGAVADRAVRDAAALQRALRLEPELARARAGGDDHGVGAVLVVADPDAEGRSEKSTLVTSSVMNSAPKRSAWRAEVLPSSPGP